jgi:hypothetical protein
MLRGFSHDAITYNVSTTLASPSPTSTEVDDLQTAVDELAADGYGLVGGIGEYEHSWRMVYVRGPEGIIVSLAQRIG